MGLSLDELGSINNTITVDPEGDLRMILDGGTLQVSRKALSLSSPFFSAMLGQHSKFMESTNKTLDLDGIQSIPFPDDKAEPMTVVAHIAHLRFDKVPAEMSFQQLFEIAVLCDKYDLKRCLGMYPDVWSKPYLDLYAQEGFENWLFISAVFKYDGLFKEVTRHLILNTRLKKGSILVTADGHAFDEHISPIVLDEITKSRAKAMFLVMDLHWQEKERLLASEQTPVCRKFGVLNVADCDAMNLGLLLQKFPHIGHPRGKSTTSWQTVESRAQAPNAIRDSCRFIPTRVGDHRSCAVGTKLVTEANKILEGVQGLQLSAIGA